MTTPGEDAGTGAGDARTDQNPRRRMPERYWLIHPNGGRQLMDPRKFELDHLVEVARRIGGRLEVEGETVVIQAGADAGTTIEITILADAPLTRAPLRFEPPISALSPLFRNRLDKVYHCLIDFEVDINTRPTSRVLGGYYKSRRLIRIYSHDGQQGRRPLEELFDTFLHEIAHHVEYTEPDSFHARECGRVPGRMHSPLFWRILGDLKARWADLQRRP